MLLLVRDELSGADFGQEEERVGYNTGGEYQVIIMMIVMIVMMTMILILVKIVLFTLMIVMMMVMIMLLVMVNNDDANGDDFNYSDDNAYDDDYHSDNDDAGQFAGRAAADRDLHRGGPGQRLRCGRHIPGTSHCQHFIIGSQNAVS